jgi:hypothetical protein
VYDCVTISVADELLPLKTGVTVTCVPLRCQDGHVSIMIGDTRISPALSQVSDDISDRLNNWVIGECRVVDVFANSVELAGRCRDPRELVSRHTKLDKSARVRRDRVPSGTSSGILDPIYEPAMDRVGQSLLLRRHILQAGEAFVAAMEERYFGTVGRCCVRWSDNVVVSTEETISPCILDIAAHVDQVINGAAKAGIAVLSATTERLAGVVGAGVCSDESTVRNVGDIGIESVDPGVEIAVLGAINDAEDRAFAVRCTSQ